MKVDIEFVHMNTSITLKNFVNEKIKHAENKFPWLIKTLVTFEKENHSKGVDKKCTIKAVIPGVDKFASANSETYQGAFKTALIEVEKQLEKQKHKMKTYI